MVSTEYPKTFNVSEETWATVMRYKISLKHKTVDETLNYFIKKMKGVKK